MKLQKVLTIGTLVGAFAGLAPAADIVDTSLANGVYYGTGNPNTGWTAADSVNAVSGDTLELGLAASIQFLGNQWSAGNTYDVPPTPTVKWNFNYSVDTNSTDQANGDTLGAYTYLITVTDTNTGAHASFNPTTAVGDNAQILANGTNACGDTPNQCAYNSGNTGMQDSEKISFASVFAPTSFNPAINALSADLYTITLAATPVNPNGTASSLTINVQVTPEPSSWLLLAAGLPLLLLLRRFRQNR